MIKLVLLRHGESTWNQENRFTGWTDVPLSEKGIEEAHAAGKSLKEKGFVFDIAFTSVLKRAVQTLDIVIDELGQDKLRIEQSWRLNERYYGGLQGLNKSQTASKFGEDQVKIWRRSYDIPPPAVEKTDERYPGNDPLYMDLAEADVPVTECLKDVVERFMPYWKSNIEPALKKSLRVLISAHGNSLRAIVKYLDDVPDDDILKLDIPTGIPLVYELDNGLKPLKKYYLADEDEVNRAIKKVADQGKAGKNSV